MVIVRRSVRSAVIGVCLAGALLAAACGGGGDDNGGGGSGDGDVKLENVNTQNATPTPDTNRPEVVVEVKDNSFNPETITIKQGTKVVWKWVDTSNSHSIMLSGTTSPEQTSGTYERVFDQKGVTYPYQCGVHGASMSGRIVVE
jgi:plastocyanin